MNPELDETQDVRGLMSRVLSASGAPKGRRVAGSVAAVVTVESDGRFLERTLAAVMEQTVIPGVIVIADCSGTTVEAVQSTYRLSHGRHRPAGESDDEVSIRVIPVHGACSFGDAVQHALRGANIPAEIRGLWLLHDDSRPGNSHCLESLMEAWHNTPTASVLGCKQLDWEGDGLHDVGAYASGRHTVISLVVDGEPDQEQYDARQDVFKVSLAGALVSLAVWNGLGGTSPAIGTFAESSDFCRRVCLSGGRVVVVPRAVVAHRRARYAGIRNQDGRVQDPAVDSYAAVADARERYRYSDIGKKKWLFVWLWRLVCAFASFIMLLSRKRPYRALCELGTPWRVLAWLPKGAGVRRRVRTQARTSLRQLNVLVARRDQVARWKERRAAFSQSHRVRLLSPLAVAHLRSSRRRRVVWGAAMCVLAFAAGVAVNPDVLGAIVRGNGLVSDTLTATSASWGQLLDAATASYTYAMGLGHAAPPAPFLLVLLLASAVTLGHVALAVSLMALFAPPLSALSFWALAGIFTRSNAVRVACGLLWCVMGGLFGVYAQGSLPMMVVMVFLPVGLAFVFRAVGMYTTEVVVSPTASVQSAALASLCLALVVVAEPQLALALVLVFVVFLIFVRSHRVMLLLIPVPGAIALAPTLVNVVRHLPQGSFRQLFADIMLPSADINGVVSSRGLPEAFAWALGLGRGDAGVPQSVAVALSASFTVIVLIAVVSLALPFALRVSRMMWAIAVTGGLLALVASRVAIAPGDGVDALCGTMVPGLMFMMTGLLACLCMVAGRAARPFSTLIPRNDSMDAARIESAHRRHYSRRNLIIVGRAVLVLVLAACIGLWGAVCGVRAHDGGRVAEAGTGLPMIAQDYLSTHPDRRILALRADSSTVVSYAVMRTARGDLIDVSPAVSAQRVDGMTDDVERSIADAAARLLLDNDDGSVESLVSMGFGGIYVPDAQDSANRELVSNILACEGTQSVVNNDSGTYVRLIAAADSHGIDSAPARSALHSPWRIAWLWTMGVVAVLYCIVAFPRFRRSNEVKA